MNPTAHDWESVQHFYLAKKQKWINQPNKNNIEPLRRRRILLLMGCIEAIFDAKFPFPICVERVNEFATLITLLE
jgi:hypothetical protein